eukprot:CAMPEP_0117648536 /NCGR_PEP_ID=MMETSP0804-20121206/459_1 /TAXON_ID=1074897 /ORGANISM="Tetraselmis astigmatica, Strain CCMP880" /LENGTH=446 /DNA_ID=CAMNT_0005454149 /DNA_START=376 /DNA_END=1716 /DNA_ORIENTATION=-
MEPNPNSETPEAPKSLDTATPPAVVVPADKAAVAAGPTGKRTRGVVATPTAKAAAPAVKPTAPPPKPDTQPQKLVDATHAATLVRELQRLVTSDVSSCDLTVNTEDGGTVALHGIVARAFAPGLAELMPSGAGSQGQACSVALPATVTGDALKALAHYMYHGELAIDNNNAGALLNAATALQLKGAQELCGRYLQTSVNKNNVLKRYVVASEHNLAELMVTVLSFIDKESTNVLGSSDWLTLDLKDIQALLSRDSLSAAESVAFNALKRWYQNDKPSREKAYLDLLQNPSVVRLPFLNADDLEELDADELIRSSADAKAVVHAELMRRVLGKPSEVKPRSGQQPMQQKKKAYLGKKISKQFEDGKLYSGAIKDVEMEESTGKLLLCVRYEDGDEEDMYEEEAVKLIAAAANGKPKATATKKTTPKPSNKRKAEASKKPTPKKNVKK